jgi:hypothetical protein
VWEGGLTIFRTHSQKKRRCTTIIVVQSSPIPRMRWNWQRSLQMHRILGVFWSSDGRAIIGSTDQDQAGWRSAAAFGVDWRLRSLRTIADSCGEEGVRRHVLCYASWTYVVDPSEKIRAIPTCHFRSAIVANQKFSALPFVLTFWRTDVVGCFFFCQERSRSSFRRRSCSSLCRSRSLSSSACPVLRAICSVLSFCLIKSTSFVSNRRPTGVIIDYVPRRLHYTTIIYPLFREYFRRNIFTEYRRNCFTE